MNFADLKVVTMSSTGQHGGEVIVGGWRGQNSTSDHKNIPPVWPTWVQGQLKNETLCAACRHGNESRLEPCWSVLLIGSLSAM